jgi:predicted transposase/invertase (TIGR01784 family)
LYYASKSYSSQIERGDEYRKLKPTFFIGILNFEITQNPHYISRHKVIDLETGENTIKDIEFNFIELPKFNKTENQLKTIIDQWVYFIKNAENLEVIPPNINDKGLQHAYQDAQKHRWSKQELEEYDYALMREQDEIGKLEFAEKKGIEKGIQEGIQKGIQEGIQKEKIDGIKKALIRNKLSIEEIAEDFEVSEDFVIEIKNKIQ